MPSQLLGNGPPLAIPHLPVAVRAADFANGGDDSGRSASEGLCHTARLGSPHPLVDGNGPLLRLVAEPAPELKQAVPRYASQ